MWMLMSVRSYDNDQEIVDKIKALRTCIDRRHHALFKKIKGGLECSTIENVKLTLIAYLLIDYQKNAEDDKEEDCLQATASARTGWKIINTFLDYVSRECRDCIVTIADQTVIGTDYDESNPPIGGSPAPIEYLIVTQSGDNIVESGADPDTLKTS